ncbi:MAG: ABC transporter permease [Acidobacteria bacterium]|nr:ABC transporter permease [Acidobacteriota bacterium]
MERQLLKDIFLTVRDSLLAYKLRSALTLLGVIIGVTVVVTVSSILTSLYASVARSIESFSPNVVYFTKQNKWGPQFGEPTAEERARKDFTYDDVLAVAALPSPLAFSPQKLRGFYGPIADQPKMTARGREAINPLVFGVWENYPEVVVVKLASGRFFTETERKSKAHVVVIGGGIAKQLFQTTDPLNEDLRLDGVTYRVVGVLEDEGTEPADRTVYTPYETLSQEYPNIKETILVVRTTPDNVDEVINDVTFTLRKRRNVPVEAPNNFGVTKAEAIFEIVNQVLTGVAAIVIPIALAGLLVGGVGVMNIMIVSVTERTSEIGVRRALGARKRDVLTQFLIEAMSLTTIGGLIGIGVGFLFAFIASLALNFSLTVPLWAIVTGLVTSASVGLIAGMYPAIRAARLDPVEAIRGT